MYESPTLTTQEAPDGGAAAAGALLTSAPAANVAAKTKTAEGKIIKFFTRYLFRSCAPLRKICSSLN